MTSFHIFYAKIYVCYLHLLFFLTSAALMHGNRETLEPVLLFSDFFSFYGAFWKLCEKVYLIEQGERNFNRFGGWLGKNSTMGKNMRLLEDVHVHILASQQTNLDR